MGTVAVRMGMAQSGSIDEDEWERSSGNIETLMLLSASMVRLTETRSPVLWYKEEDGRMTTTGQDSGRGCGDGQKGTGSEDERWMEDENVSE